MDFLRVLFEVAQKIAVENGSLVEEDGIILASSTIELVKEIEIAQIQHVIDQALDNRDFESLRKLVS